MAEGDTLKCQIEIIKTRFFNNDGNFGIVVGKPMNIEEGIPVLNNGLAVFKGLCPVQSSTINTR